MNPFLIAAALVAFGSTGLHIFAGGVEIHTPIQASDLNLPLKTISAVIWHGVSLTLLAGGISAALLAKRPNRAATLGIALFSLGYVPIFIYYAQSMLGSIWAMPQWTLFLAYSTLSLLGTKRGYKEP